MNETQARKVICEIGKLLYDRNYVVAFDGNVSIRLDENTVLSRILTVVSSRLKLRWEFEGDFLVRLDSFIENYDQKPVFLETQVKLTFFGSLVLKTEKPLSFYFALI